MRNATVTALVIIFAAALMPTAVFAHHGNAAFDYSKTVTVSGTVTSWIWANPHCWLKFDATDDSGKVAHWVVEAGTIPDNARDGWSKNTFKPGDSVVVNIMPAKTGGNIGRFRGVTVNGVKLEKGGYFK